MGFSHYSNRDLNFKSVVLKFKSLAVVLPRPVELKTTSKRRPLGRASPPSAGRRDVLTGRPEPWQLSHRRWLGGHGGPGPRPGQEARGSGWHTGDARARAGPRPGRGTAGHET